MFPYGINWDNIKIKEGDDKIVALSPVEKGLVIALILNLKLIAEHGGVPQMKDDKDVFDATVDGLLQKIII
jgi:hypothetical protein